MKEAPGSSETSVLTRAARRNNSEDTNLKNERNIFRITTFADFFNLLASWMTKEHNV
jgi:hypothetical protein